MRSVLLRVLAVVLVGSGAAWGATISVTTTDPGISVDGLCSLAEAIENANGAVRSDCTAGDQGLDKIELSDGATYTFEEAHHDSYALPAITSNILVNGHGSVLEIAQDVPHPPDLGIVEILSGTVSLNDLTIRRGLPGIVVIDGQLNLNECTVTQGSTGVVNESGGVLAINSVFSSNLEHMGVGLEIHGGSLTLIDSTVTDNTMGILSQAHYPEIPSVTLIGCAVTNNRSAPVGCGIYTEKGQLLVLNSVIADNAAFTAGGMGGTGGGIVSRGSIVEIKDSLITGNHADFYGGGIALSSERGTLDSFKMTRCTVTGNTAEHGGAGVWMRDVVATISESTFSGNIAAEEGGAIGTHSDSADVGLVIDSSTFSGNSANAGSGLFARLDGPERSAWITLKNSILAANEDSCTFDDGFDFTSEGFNLATDDSCNLDHPTDMIVDDAMLSDLGDYGGYTPVHMPLEGSPAIDMGGDECGARDQRGYRRPADGDGDGVAVCDCGAVEYGAEPPVSRSLPGFPQQQQVPPMYE